MASVRSPMKLLHLMPSHMNLRLQWNQKYMSLDISCVLFTDETTETLDGSNGWANGWVYFGDERYLRLRRQHQGGWVILWSGIIGDRYIGLVIGPEVFNVTAAAYCNFLKEVLDPWLDGITLSLLRTLLFMHANTLSHSAMVTRAIYRFLWHTRWKFDGVFTCLSGYQPLSIIFGPSLNKWTQIYVERYFMGDHQSCSGGSPNCYEKKLTDFRTNRKLILPNNSLRQ